MFLMEKFIGLKNGQILTFFNVNGLKIKLYMLVF